MDLRRVGVDLAALARTRGLDPEDDVRTALTALMLLHSGGLGGAGRAAVSLCRALVARGAAIRVLVADDALDLVPDLTASGVEVLLAEPRMSWWTTHQHDPSRFGRDPRFDDVATMRIIRELHDHPCDIVITQSGVIAHAAFAAAALGVPHVWMLSEIGDPDHGAVLPFEGEHLGSAVSSLSDLVVVPSAFVRQRLGLDRSQRTIVLSPPLDRELLARAPEQHRHGDAPILLSIGSLTPAKGHEDVIAALALLRHEHPAMLRIVGAGTGEHRSRIEECVAAHGLDDAVTVVPPVADRNSLYAECDVVVVAARNEAFGLVPHEAALAGRPVVYAASGGVAEFMDPGVTGLAFEVGDTVQLAAHLRQLIEDDAHRASLVVSARSVALARAEDDTQIDALWSELVRLARDGASEDPARELLRATVSTAITLRHEVDELTWRLAVLRDRRAVRIALGAAGVLARLRRR